MKMSRFIAGLLFPALLLGLVLLFEPATAQAKQYFLQNKTGSRITVTLVVPTSRGWYVQGWYSIAPYSYKSVTIGHAGGNYFAFYAHDSRGTVWRGSGNAPTIPIVSNAMGYYVGQKPYGNNFRYVKLRVKSGYSVTFT